MIKFFRKIRQNMIKENKVRSYLLYAIGEIVLVVIGILFALQINNWNETKKLDSQIIKGLTEIRENLIGDSLSLYKAHKLKLEDIKIQKGVIQLLNNDKPLNNTIQKSLGRVMLVRHVKLVQDGYTILKNIGLERIDDSDLRLGLIEYYENIRTGIEKDIKDDELEFEDTLLPYVRSNFSDWDYGRYGIPLDYNKLKKDTYFKTSLKINLGNAGSTIRTFEYGLKKSRILISILNSYLHKSND